MSAGRPAPEASVPVIVVKPISPWQQKVAPATDKPPSIPLAPIAPWADAAVAPSRPPERLRAPASPAAPVDVARERARVEQERQEIDALVRRLTLPRHQWRRPSQLEATWGDCLLFPLRAWRPLLRLAALLGVATIWMSMLLVNGPLSFPLHALPLLVFALACAFLHSVLASAVAGQAPRVEYPGIRALPVVLEQYCRWAYCFVAGPVLPAALALYYWIHCGDPSILDILILADLVGSAAGYWLLALTASTRSGRLRDANPWRVAELVERLGYRAAVAVGLVTLIVVVHGFRLSAGLAHAHRSGFDGWLSLSITWLSLLACMTFLLRLVGVWTFRCGGDAVRVSPQAALSGA